MYSIPATLLVGRRISSNVVTPKCRGRTLRVLGSGGGKGCGVIRVSLRCGPTPVRRGSICNIAFRRNEGRLGVSRDSLLGVIARDGRLPRDTGHSLVVSLVALGCARSGSMYCTGSNRAVNINTNRRSEVRYAHLTNGGTSG